MLERLGRCLRRLRPEANPKTNINARRVRTMPGGSSIAGMDATPRRHHFDLVSKNPRYWRFSAMLLKEAAHRLDMWHLDNRGPGKPRPEEQRHHC